MILIPEGFEVKRSEESYKFHTQQYHNINKESLGLAIGISAVPRNYLSREFLEQAIPQIIQKGFVDDVVIKQGEAQGINWVTYFTDVAQQLIIQSKAETWNDRKTNDLLSLASAMANIINEGCHYNKIPRVSLDILVKDIQTVPISHPIKGIEFDKPLYGFEIHSLIYPK